LQAAYKPNSSVGNSSVHHQMQILQMGNLILYCYVRSISKQIF